MLKLLHLSAILAWIQTHAPRQSLRGYVRIPTQVDWEKYGAGLATVGPLAGIDRERLSQFWVSWMGWLRFLHVLVPSFLQQSQGTPKQLHPSAWLDGLRGVAAFFVVWHHASLLWFGWHVHNGFGSTEEDRLFIQWPFVRLLIAGHPPVMIFFAVSGYAISYKPLKLSRQGRFAELGDALSSTVFRRWTRLFLPAMAITLATALATRWSIFGEPGEGWADVAISARGPTRFDTVAEQLLDWYHNTMHLVDPMSRDMHRAILNGYDPNLWTLPIEFDCSLVIFLTLAAFSRLRPGVRLLTTLCLILFANYHLYWRIMLFMSGMFICDLQFHLSSAASKPASLLPDQEPEPAPAAPRYSIPQLSPNQRSALWTTSFILALYVLCMPETARGAAVTPGYITLTNMVPQRYSDQQDHFWIPLAAIWLIFTVDRAPHLQAIFTHRFPQYLGKISYSLYLIHGPLLWSWGRKAAMVCVDGITGRETAETYCFGILLAACLFWLVAICLADLVWRGVDAKSVEFGRAAYEYFSVRKEEERT